MINGLRASRRPLFLASVSSAEEARTAVSGGAGLIDCKEPSRGALGALTGREIASICAAVGGRTLVSATAGDLPTDARTMVNAAGEIASAGADIVKVGFFGDAPAREAVAALGSAPLGGARLVGVLMADRAPDLSIIPDLAAAGFAGVMLDTADKTAGALLDVMDARALAEFIAMAHAHRLAAGLAGSLAIAHIPAVVACGPDIVGFRGALCDGSRSGALDLERVQEVRRALDAASGVSEILERTVA